MRPNRHSTDHDLECRRHRVAGYRKRHLARPSSRGAVRRVDGLGYGLRQQVDGGSGVDQHVRQVRLRLSFRVVGTVIGGGGTVAITPPPDLVYRHVVVEVVCVVLPFALFV